MSTMSATRRTSSTSSQVRAGLAISAFLGITNVPFLFAPTPPGSDAPPVAVLVLSGLLGVVSVICAVVAWRSGNRVAIRINAAALLINALTSLPAFFVDVEAWVKVAAAASILLTVAALVLTLRREAAPYTVSD